MNVLVLPYVHLEAIMKQALTVAALTFAVVFVGGVLFGWEYGMFLAFVVLLAFTLVQWAQGRK